MTMLSLSLKMEYGLKSRELVQPSLRAFANIYKYGSLVCII